MAGLTLTLNTAKQALLNTQVEIQTASNNISNAQSTNYARQTAVLQSNASIQSANGWIGTGANVATVIQNRDQFLEQRLRNATSGESQYSTLSSQITGIQNVLSDNGKTGISQMLGNFSDAWDQLSQNPSGAAQQTGVYSAAQNLAQTISTTYSNLSSMDTNDIPNQIQDTVDKANSLIDQIAQYNTAIAQSETPGNTMNSLRDSRYQALSDLSKLIPVDFTEAADGTVTVTTQDASGPVTVVSNGTPTHLINTTAAPSTVTGGKLGGLITAKSDLETYMGRLNTFASSLISQVNSLHAAGSTVGPPVFTGTDASTIAASTTFLNGQSSTDETNRAVALSGLQDTQITFGDGKSATLTGYLADIQKQMGTDAQQANSSESFNKTLQTQLQTQQQSVSGVSLDEEMVNMIQYQQAYQAAAKLITVASTLLSTVINMVPTV